MLAHFTRSKSVKVGIGPTKEAAISIEHVWLERNKRPLKNVFVLFLPHSFHRLASCVAC